MQACVIVRWNGGSHTWLVLVVVGVGAITFSFSVTLEFADAAALARSPTATFVAFAAFCSPRLKAPSSLHANCSGRKWSERSAAMAVLGVSKAWQGGMDDDDDKRRERGERVEEVGGDSKRAPTHTLAAHWGQNATGMPANPPPGSAASCSEQLSPLPCL